MRKIRVLDARGKLLLVTLHERAHATATLPLLLSPLSFLFFLPHIHHFRHTYHDLYLVSFTLHPTGVRVSPIHSSFLTSMPSPSPTSSTSTMASRPWVSDRVAQNILVYLHYVSPIILLAFFLIAFTTHSILTASKVDGQPTSSDQTGPGGKPLPRNTSPSAKAGKKNASLDFSPSRKLLFNWLSAGTILTFLGNAATVIVHALLDRKDNWWCGQSVVVGQ